jgi:hypothetical protein
MRIRVDIISETILVLKIVYRTDLSKKEEAGGLQGTGKICA